MTLLHATAVAVRTPLGWRAALLRGPSASGKSDLALRLIGIGWRLIGDDYVHAWTSGDGVYVSAAERIAGILEARGVGLVGAPALQVARAALLVDCQDQVERLPDLSEEPIDGRPLRRLALAALEPSAPDKVRAALLGRDMASRLEP